MSTEGQRVIEFARKQKGQIVGNGECWTLAEEALIDARAVTSTDIHGAKIGGTVNYVWGDEVKLGSVVPGDIIQFLAGYGFDKHMYRPLDGAKWLGDGVGPVSLQHTAIVDAIMVPGVSFNVLHQNWEGKKLVVRTEFFFKKYSYTDPDGNTVSVTVNGKAKFYRPRRKPQ